MSENIILNKLIQIGDRVQVNWTDTSSGWRPRPDIPENGVQGTVIGFDRYTISRDRFDFSVPKSGIYSYNGMPLVKWDNGHYSKTSSHDICFVDPQLKEVRQANQVYCDTFETGYYIGPLPESKYQIGNKVLFLWANTNKINKGTIESIDYTDSEGSNIYYQIRIIETDWTDHEVEGGCTLMNENDIISLLDDGNYQRWDRGEKNMLVFKDLAEECAFFRSLNKIRQVKNPATDNYDWDVTDIDKGIREGNIHLAGQSGGLFGSSVFPIAYVMDDDLEDLKNRVREKWIADNNT